ncbi:MAG: hypothetical protein QNL99_08050 [SAR86 cluster bacterium]|jgi:hypothetical protein|uniref:Uncharacterized protein n=1 Tax=SAR86 cluster bacterium TaxID=2030880 RepID=A0A973AA38_9GAMM|nr:hypothetical protein [SAR86 cluster bacterium]
MEFGIIFIAILIASVAVFVFYKMKAKKPEAEPVDESVGPGPVEDLLSLNLDMRKSMMAASLVEITEELIDLIVDLLPLVREQASASGELTWTVNRIASEYLPNKCVYPFIKLDKNSQSDAGIVASYTDSIGALKDELVAVKAMVVSRDVQQFSAKAKFLKNRFDNTGS